MGLDMYASRAKFQPEVPVDFDLPEGVEPEELHYWRKHPNLHGWMEALYREKNGSAESFNCTNVALTTEDLDRLEAAIRANELPQTSGFFFGASDGSEIEDDLQFVTEARAAIAAGDTVFYSSWW